MEIRILDEYDGLLISIKNNGKYFDTEEFKESAHALDSLNFILKVSDFRRYNRVLGLNQVTVKVFYSTAVQAQENS